MILTPEERAAVQTLERLAGRWPASLWLFSGSGTLYVMRRNAAGEMAATAQGGFDPAFIVTSIPISNDGGDW